MIAMLCLAVKVVACIIAVVVIVTGALFAMSEEDGPDCKP
tara:strand:- start:224 stop:343 length:120 start_codon:yes stop_codon:yes gene_type:complete